MYDACTVDRLNVQRALLEDCLVMMHIKVKHM